MSDEIAASVLDVPQVATEPASTDNVEISASPQPEQSKEVMGFLAASAKNPWLCLNGHLMGLIVRKKVDGATVSRLYVLRLAFHPEQVVPETMVFALIDSGTVSCSICGSTREWRPGFDFLERANHKHRRRSR